MEQTLSAASPEQAPIIELKNVRKTFTDKYDIHAIKDLSLEVFPGEFVFIVGRNASGKSTLFNLIIRELKPTSGEIKVAGIDLAKMREKDKPYYRRQIGVVFQDFKLLQDMSVFENIAFAMHVTHRYKKEEIIKRVGIDEFGPCTDH